MLFSILATLPVSSAKKKIIVNALEINKQKKIVASNVV